MAQYPKAVVAAQSIINDNSFLDDSESYTVCVTAGDLASLMDAVNILVDAGWYVNGGITAAQAPQSYLIVLSYEEDEE